MGDCCSPRGYRRIFSPRRAHSEAERYRKKGLTGTSRGIAELLVARGVAGCTVLEVGGGIGALQIELLRAGASSAVSVELTPTYEDDAGQLLGEAGLDDRVERRVIDFVEAGPDVPAADVVVMNRVICCYPDMPRLVGAAAGHTRGVLVMTFPKRTWWTRAGLGLANGVLMLARREFHIFLHPPDAVARIVEQHGLRPRVSRRGLFWQTASWESVAA